MEKTQTEDMYNYWWNEFAQRNGLFCSGLYTKATKNHVVKKFH